MQTLRAGCSKAGPKIFAPPADPFPWAWEGQNLISRRWALYFTYTPTTQFIMVARPLRRISSVQTDASSVVNDVCINCLQASEFPAAGDVWRMLLSGSSHQTNSLSRADVQRIDDGLMHKLADIFNLPRRQLADSSSSVKHTEL